MIGAELSKWLSFFIRPLGLVFILFILGLILHYRRKKAGMRLIGTGILLLWLFSTPLLHRWLADPLEQQFLPQPATSLPKADVIILLGGGVMPALPPRQYPQLTQSASRVLHAAALYHAGKAKIIIVSGGGRSTWPSEYSEAAAMRDVLMRLDVPAQAIVEENRSLNTVQNASYTKEILSSRSFNQVLLVTSSLHMPRAKIIFEDLGIPVIPAASDVESLSFNTQRGEGFFPSWIEELIPNPWSLYGTNRAIGEWIGQYVFKLQK